MEPRSRHVPVARDCVLGNLEDARNLLVVQAAEVAQFHYLAAARVHFRKTLERFVEPKHFRSGHTRHRGGFIE